jgi:hypothetical protein
MCGCGVEDSTSTWFIIHNDGPMSMELAAPGCKRPLGGTIAEAGILELAELQLR